MKFGQDADYAQTNHPMQESFDGSRSVKECHVKALGNIEIFLLVGAIVEERKIIYGDDKQYAPQEGD